MAGNGYQGALTPIVAGFREFFVTTSAYAVACKTKLSTIPIVNKTTGVVAAVATAIATLLISFVLVATSSRRSRSRKMELEKSINQEGGFLQKLKKWRVVKLTLFCMEKTLNAVEYLLAPSSLVKGNESPKLNGDATLPPVTPFNGIPMLINIRHLTKSTDGDTPNNNQKFCSDTDWTPFSSVSATGLDRTSACVSLMDDLSQSTISTPIHDIRQQLVQKIRTWRHAIRDLEGTPEFPSWSPPEKSRNKQESTGLGRLWNLLAGWFSRHPSRSPYSHANGSAQRKRKRMDGDEDDDDISLYLPQHKSQPPRSNSEGLLSSTKTVETEIPTIRGLSVVPIIGNWFADPLTVNEKPLAPEQDHIALIQHAFLSPAKRANQPKSHSVSNEQGNGSDTEPYEVLELEQDMTSKSVDGSAEQSSLVQPLDTSEGDLYATQSSSYSSGSESE